MLPNLDSVQLLYGWFRRHPTVVDTAWALLLLLLTGMQLRGNGPGYQPRSVFVPMSVLLCALVAIRRRWPDAAVAAGIAVGLLQIAVHLHPGVPDCALLALAYTAAALGTRWTSRVALAAAVLGGPLLELRFHVSRGSDAPQLGAGLLLATPLVACWVLGRLTRTRRAYYAELEDRAARLERERDAKSQIAVAAERARIARELHDVVAHNVSVMIVQADGAAYVMDTAPEQARKALEHIAGTGRQALEEMRRLLGVLRSSDAAGEYVPQPGVEQLPELLDQVRRAGLPVAFAVEGEPRPLPRGVELTAYRIVQEALTNARKHAGPEARAGVRVGFDRSGMRVVVEDDGAGSQERLVREGGEDRLGHGLIGMRERVGMVGGRLEAGPREGGGFRVDAYLPLPAAAAGAPAAPAEPVVAVPAAPAVPAMPRARHEPDAASAVPAVPAAPVAPVATAPGGERETPATERR